jgi:integrase/recombinase XerD
MATTIYYMLSSEEFKNYVTDFKAWLRVLGYSGNTIKNHPKALQEFFFHLEKAGIKSIEQISQQAVDNYCEWLKIRPNQKYAGALGTSQINRHYGVIEKFKEYIERKEGKKIPYEITRLKRERNPEVDFLEEDEIKALYNVTDETPHGYRDRAMLSVYYGCGLRRNEGAQLDRDHILTDKKMLLVTQPKNNYERYVPITGKHFLHITQYMETARPFFLSLHSKEQALFISERGQRLGAQMMYIRLQRLAELAGINKTIGVHTLRHSIATHLLKKGMELENIALFLGHRSLDSTQIYTHILNETE